jgi:uncharacterized membrane protein
MQNQEMASEDKKKSYLIGMVMVLMLMTTFMNLHQRFFNFLSSFFLSMLEQTWNERETKMHNSEK